MGDLLNRALEAHGGLDRWRRFTDVEATISVTGAVWSLKRKLEAFDAVSVSAAIQDPCLILRPFPAPDRLGFFEPRCVTIETLEERVLFRRQNPATAFVGHARDTPWDPCHAVYVLGVTLWTCLTTPFLYAYPGFESEEISPCEENGEEWRRLAVRFPSDMPAHAQQQIACFGPDGLLRRYDSTWDVLGATPVADYASDYDDVAGIMLAKTRRIFDASAGGPVTGLPLMTIDIADTALC